MGRNSEFQEGNAPYSYKFKNSKFFAEVTAHHQGKKVGEMWWNKDSGEIENIDVKPEHRRRGVATGMWNHAHSNAREAGVARPVHAVMRSNAGDAWAKAVGGEIPSLRIPFTHENE